MTYGEAVAEAESWLERAREEINTGCYMAGGLSVAMGQGYAVLATALRGRDEWSQAQPAVFGEPPF